MDGVYTIHEIDRLRRAVRALRWHSYPQVHWSGAGGGGPLDQALPGWQATWERETEEQLRTYIMANTRPEDLEAHIQSLIDPVRVGSYWRHLRGIADEILRVVKIEPNGFVSVKFGICGSGGFQSALELAQLCSGPVDPVEAEAWLAQQKAVRAG